MPHGHRPQLHHLHYLRARAPRARTTLLSALLPALLPVLLAACGSGANDPITPGVQSATMGAMSKVAGDMASETVLTPVSATASASERGDLSAAAAIDHDDNTRWSSGFSDDQWLTLDYGQSVIINRVRIAWENAHATQYALQVSDDNSHWTTIKTVTDSAGGTEDFTGLSGQGRYLRLQGVKRSTQYGYSVFEIQAFSGTPASTTPPPTTIPADTGKPGVAIGSVKATASSTENGGMSADMAVDGKPNTRWASKAEDGAWIQFDFGSKTPVGYMKLTWENAYGKEYALQVSDDGKTWSQLRYVGEGKGGTEEFFNLNTNARFIRLQGVTRATQYGYSLYEVEFKTPGSDNTLPAVATTPLKFPAGGSGWTPLPAALSPIETLQFSLPDGTLVTRFGARAMARHGRERGEDWNEIGYGPDETVDPATGLPLDKGPGNYLTFVPHYFQHRTWGIEIVDNSRVVGVTKPTLVYNQYTQVDFLPGQVAFFRGFDRPGVTGYGWMNPGELVDNTVTVCHPTAYPAAGQLAAPGGINGACTLRIRDYPGHADLGPDGFPNGKNVNARPLVVGDVIEVAPSMFGASSAQMSTDGDNGNVRYYGPEWVYVVGTGLRPWYGVQPRLNSVPLPDDTLSGGLGSVSYNYSDNALFMFQQPQNNVGMQNAQRFVEGRRLVHSSFTTGEHNEPGNTPYLPVMNLQGAHFNQSACIGCHVNNGRSPAATNVNQKLDAMSIRVAALTGGVQVPHPQYGTAIQMNGLTTTGATRNWGSAVRVGAFESKTVRLADGTAVELRKPTLAFEGPVPEIYSLRAAQPMIGTGLLEAVAEADILSRARTAPDADGVKGVANFVYDPESGAVRLGRFGWKAAKATLRHQAAEALLLDMGVTSPVYPNRACMTGPAGCAAGGSQAGISEADLQSISHYLSLVAVPAQRSLPSGFPKGVAPIDELRVDPGQVGAGARLFGGMRCTACHTAELKTGSGHLFAELRNQTIHPYSDLLLHDMGDGLADRFAEGQARGSMWRTAPLWGIGYTDKVLGNSTRVGYLHDGRARTLTEAIMWHAGEANAARSRFENLSKADRDAVLAFLKSL